MVSRMSVSANLAKYPLSFEMKATFPTQFSIRNVVGHFEFWGIAKVAYSTPVIRAEARKHDCLAEFDARGAARNKEELVRCCSCFLISA